MISLSPSLPTFESAPIPITPPPPLSKVQKPTQQPSPAFSDDLEIQPMEVPWEKNHLGEWVRIGQSSPPTSSSERASPAPGFESPVPSRRSSLSRSESVPLVTESATTARSFQRTSSGPIAFPGTGSSTPAAATTRMPHSTGLSSTARRIGGARRVKLDDVRESNESKYQTQEKENADTLPIASSSSLPTSRPLADVVPVPQRGISAQARQVLPVPRASRLAKKVETISEAEDVDGEASARSSLSSLASSVGVRPRRSASLSEAQSDLPPLHQFPRFGAASRGARRVTLEEKIRQEREIAREEGYAMREAEEAVEAERRANALAESQAQSQAPPPPNYLRKTPSPTHISQTHLRALHGHQRRDSDTLRSLSTAMATSSSPTAVEHPSRNSSSPSNFSTTTTATAVPNGRHRRNPTTSETPTANGMTAPPGLSINTAGKTWAAGESRDSDAGTPLEDKGPQSALPPKSASMLPPPIPVKQVQSNPNPSVNPLGNRNIIVNKKAYARLDQIGKGGSSRVYRVMTGANEIFAIKRVSLDKIDADTMGGYMNEIALLKRLEGNSRIIRLVDSEVRAGAGGTKGHLMLVMECGEIDLARLVQEQQKEPMDLVWISYYWKQMLQAVQVIHEEKIVHSDLKPANFVLVKGQLKLIDFGIANAIANDTTNIQRDHQIGTVNYMSPEAIELPDGMRRLKVGRQSDVWSLGCILYQMVYGHPPFQHLSVYQKMKAIPDGTHIIDFPEYSTPTLPASRNGSASPPKKLDHLKVPVPKSVIETIKSCLNRNPKARATIPELLAQNWLTMRDSEPTPAPPPPSPPPPALREDETIINPHFMMQLLSWGIRLGSEGRPMAGEDLKLEAERLVQELKSVNSTSAPP